MDTTSLTMVANQLRIDIVSMTAEAKSGHPGGSLSAAEILTALYFGGVLDYDPSNPTWEERDWFVLAKGHAAPVLYATLARAGYFSPDELPRLRKLDSMLQGHPDCRRVPGVEVSTGSLGQGLSISCGIAAGLRIYGRSQTVFCLLGDGECQEGQVWEAAMFAAHQSLDNLVAIVDRNRLQIDGPTATVCNLEDLPKKFEAFGWTVSVVDGHDFEALLPALTKAKASRDGQPHMIIADTIKGRGVSFMEGEVSWHGRAPSPEERDQALEELMALMPAENDGAEA